jgi:tetratricopeptide (TPR) repeat protein
MTQKETILFRLTELMFQKEQAVLLLDDLYEDEIISASIRNIQIDSPFQVLLFDGVLSQYVVEDSVSISFTVESYFQYVLARFLQNDSRYDTPESLLQLLKENKLKGLPEAVSNLLSFDVEKGAFKRLTGFIDLTDEGIETLDLCVIPVIHSIQVNGVESTLATMLAKTTENDWIIMLNVYHVLFEFHNNNISDFLRRVIDINPLQGKSSILLGIYSLEFMSVEMSYVYQKRIEEKIHSKISDHTILNALASWYLNIGNFDKALECFDNCLLNVIETHGENNVYIASIYSDIGKVYLEIGDFSKSLKCCEKSLEIRINHYTNDHIDTATSLNNLGVLFLAMGDDKKASQFFEKALNVYQKIVGENHRFTAILYNNLGEILKNNMNYIQGLNCVEKANTILLKLLGDNHPDLAFPILNLGMIFQSMGNFDKAMDNFDKTLKIRINAYGEQHPLVSDSYHLIATLYFEQKNFENAIDYYKKSLLLRIKFYGNNDKLLSSIYFCIGQCEMYLSFFENAILSFDKGFKSEKKGGYPYKIGQCYEALNEGRSALNYYIQSAEIRKDDLGLEVGTTKESIFNALRLAKELDKENELPDWIKNLKK